MLVQRFLQAFNGGDARRLDGLFASQLAFRWYSTDAPGERFGDAALDRATLVSYFVGRHAEGERLRLRSFRFTGNSSGYGHFGLGLERSADGLPPGDYHGKGAAVCTEGGNVIAVWSMARKRQKDRVSR